MNTDPLRSMEVLGRTHRSYRSSDTTFCFLKDVEQQILEVIEIISQFIFLF